MTTPLKIIIIKIKKILVKAYNSVRKVKKYYVLLYYAYKIIRDEV